MRGSIKIYNRQSTPVHVSSPPAPACGVVVLFFPLRMAIRNCEFSQPQGNRLHKLGQSFKVRTALLKYRRCGFPNTTTRERLFASESPQTGFLIRKRISIREGGEKEERIKVGSHDDKTTGTSDKSIARDKNADSFEHGRRSAAAAAAERPQKQHSSSSV